MKNSKLLRLATYHGTPRPGDARHVTPINISRLQKILDMTSGAPKVARKWLKQNPHEPHTVEPTASEAKPWNKPWDQ
jgi:hypothetical protein